MQLLTRNLVATRMKELHINQSELAKHAECTASMISLFLHDKTNLSLEKQMKIAQALGIELNVDHRLLEKAAQASTMSHHSLKSLAIGIQEIADQAVDPEELGRRVADMLRANNLITQSRYTELFGEAPTDTVTPKAG